MTNGFKVIDALGRIKTANDPSGMIIGTTVEAWDADLDALAAQTGSGVVCRTGANLWTTRVITGAGAVTVTDGGGITGAPTISISALAGDVWTGPITISDAAWRGSSTTPVQMIAAGGANTIILPHRVVMHTNTAVVYGASRTTSIVWSGSTSTALVALGTPNMVATGVRYQIAEPALIIANATGTIMSNSPVMFFTSADTTGGDAANIIRIWIKYSIVSIA